MPEAEGVAMSTETKDAAARLREDLGVGGSYDSDVRIVLDALDAERAKTARLREALGRIASVETRPQDRNTLVGRCLIACRDAARAALRETGGEP